MVSLFALHRLDASTLGITQDGALHTLTFGNAFYPIHCKTRQRPCRSQILQLSFRSKAATNFPPTKEEQGRQERSR